MNLVAPVKIAIIQHDIVWNNVAANHAALEPKLSEASDQGAKIVVLPEMFNTGFSFLTGSAAKEAFTTGSEWLIECSHKFQIAIGASLPAPGPDQKFDRPHNRFLLTDRGNLVLSYDKIHLFSPSGEGREYSKGVTTCSGLCCGLRITPFICYDLRFPQPFSTLAADSDLFIVVANWPQARAHHWRSLLVARAIETQSYLVGVNRVGEGGGLRYIGGSLALSPRGEILVDGGEADSVSYFMVDPAEVTSYRTDFPVFADRRQGIDY